MRIALGAIRIAPAATRTAPGATANNTWEYHQGISPGALREHPISAGLAPVGITTPQLPARSINAFALPPACPGGSNDSLANPAVLGHGLRRGGAMRGPLRVGDGLAGRPTGGEMGAVSRMNRAFACMPAVRFVHFSARFGAVFVPSGAKTACFEDFTRPTRKHGTHFSGGARDRRFRMRAAMKSPDGLRRCRFKDVYAGRFERLGKTS